MPRKAKMQVEIVCEKCGKKPPINKEQTNDNWICYHTAEPCSCGGKWTHKIINK